ncbi:transporter substrate-binding domain-containing protein [Paenibacillus algorifonticola]|uniref:transporter substrate-binding domain-containing protein n=1 Tax=Paenibacillus algorifonticola TaxID=684063 RepID=UPI003D2A98BD
MRILNFKNILILSFSLIIAISLTGCGAANNEAVTSVNGSSPSNEEQPQLIKVGTSAVIKNVSFLDDAGKLTGYDVEVVREIDRRLPQYEFEFETMDFPNLFLSLEAQKIDFIAMHLEQNEERRTKYLFNKEFYDSSELLVAVNESNTSIHSIDDLKGKTVIVPPSTSSAALVEKYNKDHQNAIKVIYGDYTNAVNQLKSGRVDATVIDSGLAKSLNRDANAQLKLIGENLHTESGVYFAFRQKDGSVFSNAVDEALKAMKEDGTLTKLAEQWLKRDYQ